jgi:hypothetical protein
MDNPHATLLALPTHDGLTRRRRSRQRHRWLTGHRRAARSHLPREGRDAGREEEAFAFYRIWSEHHDFGAVAALANIEHDTDARQLAAMKDDQIARTNAAVGLSRVRRDPPPPPRIPPAPTDAQIPSAPRRRGSGACGRCSPREWSTLYRRPMSHGRSAAKSWTAYHCSSSSPLRPSLCEATLMSVSTFGNSAGFFGQHGLGHSGGWRWKESWSKDGAFFALYPAPR